MPDLRDRPAARAVDSSVVGTVVRLARFPVKSTAGEALSSAAVDARGLVGDRQWAIYTADGGIASGKTSHRFRKVVGLLSWRSAIVSPDVDPTPRLYDPDGGDYRVDDPAAAQALRQAFGQPLTPRPEGDDLHFDDCGVHLTTSSSLRAISESAGGEVDPGRFRANLVIDTEGSGFVEDDWIGGTLAVGPQVVLRLGPGMPRCVMIDQPQHGVAADTRALKALGRVHDVVLGLQAEVLRTGVISIGDEARLSLS